MRLFLILAAVVLLTEPLFAAETRIDKSLVIQKLGNDLFSVFQRKYHRITKKPKIVLAEVSGSTSDFTKEDVLAVVDLFEVKLSSFVEVLDRRQSNYITGEQTFQQSGSVKDSDIRDIGGKYGASQIVFLSFKEVIAKINKVKAQVAVTAKLTSIDVVTQKKVLNELVSARYEHEILAETYYVRDSSSFVLGTISLATLVGGIYYGAKTSETKAKYDKEKDPDEAEKLREETQGYEKIAYACGGVSLITILWKFKLDTKERNQEVYHEYELLGRDGRNLGFGARLTWNF